MLKFIGTGSAFNTALGNNSAYIKNGKRMFLIDCGSANFHRMKESGLLDDVEEIVVYVTHTHPDHVGSLGDLIFYMYYTKGELKPRVHVITADSTVSTLLHLNGVSLKLYTHSLLLEGQETHLNSLDYTIIPVKMSHVEELESYGLLIRDNKTEEIVFYTGDTNEFTLNHLEALKEDELSKFYIDTCSNDYDGNVHLSIKKLREAIPKELRHKVWCMHLDEGFNVFQAKVLGFNVAEVDM